MEDPVDKPIKERDLKLEENHSSGPEDFDLTPVVQPEQRTLVPYDPLQMYLLEIKRYKLLTREEVKSARRTSAGSALSRSCFARPGSS